MIVHLTAALVDGIAVEDHHLDARQEVRHHDIRRQDSVGAVGDGFVVTREALLARSEHVGARGLQEPRTLVATTPQLRLQRAQHRVGIGV